MKPTGAWIFKMRSTSLCAPTLGLARILFPTREAQRWMKVLGMLQIQSHRVGLFVPFSRQGLFWKGDIKRKIRPAMSWNWTKCDEALMKGKKNRKEERKMGLSLPEGAFIWKLPQMTALSTFSSFQEALPKCFCHMLWEEIEADANDPEFGGLVVIRGKEMHDTSRTVLSRLFLFPSPDRPEFIQSDIEECKQNCHGASDWWSVGIQKSFP